ncbi:tripartite tricarboxylate transporter substrate binding protein [Bradyrhizobium sp. LHD-71]|uniref:Bug family tripartite tricarboxylate transporter substrate binding protein n=1 Tax=Bradyrhizobium sp. LHD-71 TaxID=3072141 RepID=UPI00280CD865|nr:tripartite tricarboxylate transporter substrate binding protein [Bradyrhizobium sp. LHD-71]MDQ8729207.1 tripartite tricarboxylate transporter substrate binding protein [Bradyrhizobium sp. LHD-71]
MAAYSLSDGGLKRREEQRAVASRLRLGLSRWSRAALLGMILAMPYAAHVTAADAYPDRPVRVIVPYPAGGAADVVARITAEYLTEELGKQVFIDNRGGAGGTIGTGIAAEAPADGYSLVMHTISSAVLNKFLYKNIDMDVGNRFAPISQIGTATQLLVVNSNVPAKNLQEFVALLKSNPRKYRYGSSGLGAIMHLGGELFGFMSQTEAVHIAYKGEAQAMKDTLSGQTHFMIGSAPALLPHIRSGKLRALSVNADHRLALLPDVPTSSEAGLPGYITFNWYAMFAPLGTPEPIVKRLNEAVKKAMARPDAQKRFADVGIEPVTSDPAALTAELKQQDAFWGPLIERTGVKLD